MRNFPTGRLRNHLMNCLIDSSGIPKQFFGIPQNTHYTTSDSLSDKSFQRRYQKANKRPPFLLEKLDSSLEHMLGKE